MSEPSKEVIQQAKEAASRFVQNLMNGTIDPEDMEGAQVFKITKDRGMEEVSAEELQNDIQEFKSDSEEDDKCEAVEEWIEPSYPVKAEDIKEALGDLFTVSEDLQTLKEAAEDLGKERAAILSVLTNDMRLPSNYIIEIIKARDWMSKKLFKRFLKEYVAAIEGVE